MKKIIIGTILIACALFAFGQSHAGAIGITANFAYGSSEIGAEIMPIKNLTIRPAFSFSMSTNTTANNAVVQDPIRNAHEYHTMSFGGSLAVFYTLYKTGMIELALGPAGSINYEMNTWAWTETDSTVPPASVTSWSQNTLSYTGSVLGQVKFFLAPNFALFSDFGAKFSTGSTRYANVLTADGQKPMQSELGRDYKYDTAYYSVSLVAPSIGAVFYLK